MTTTDSAKKLQDLRVFHVGIGLVLFLQGLLIWLLSSNFSLPITTSYLQKDIDLSVLVPTVQQVARIEVGNLVVVFMLIAGLSHLIIALPAVFARYTKYIEINKNPFRWIEYAITAPIMIVVLGLLTGIFDLTTLILLVGSTASMILFGSLMESINGGRRKTNWLPFIYGSVAGILPWLIIWMYIVGAREISLISAAIIFAFFSLMLFFALFPINLFLYYKKIGPWKNYEFTETMFIMLSLVSKSALAWQVFLGILG